MFQVERRQRMDRRQPGHRRPHSTEAGHGRVGQDEQECKLAAIGETPIFIKPASMTGSATPV